MNKNSFLCSFLNGLMGFLFISHFIFAGSIEQLEKYENTHFNSFAEEVFFRRLGGVLNSQGYRIAWNPLRVRQRFFYHQAKQSRKNWMSFLKQKSEQKEGSFFFQEEPPLKRIHAFLGWVIHPYTNTALGEEVFVSGLKKVSFSLIDFQEALVNSHFFDDFKESDWIYFFELALFELPCARLLQGKFQWTNQDFAFLNWIESHFDSERIQIQKRDLLGEDPVAAFWLEEGKKWRAGVRVWDFLERFNTAVQAWRLNLKSVYFDKVHQELEEVHDFPSLFPSEALLFFDELPSIRQRKNLSWEIMISSAPVPFLKQ